MAEQRYAVWYEVPMPASMLARIPKDGEPWPGVRRYMSPHSTRLDDDPVPMTRETAEWYAREYGGTIEELEPKDKTP